MCMFSASESAAVAFGEKSSAYEDTRDSRRSADDADVTSNECLSSSRYDLSPLLSVLLLVSTN